MLHFLPYASFFAGLSLKGGSSRIANTKIQNLHLDKLIAWLVRHGQDTRLPYTFYPLRSIY